MEDSELQDMAEELAAHVNPWLDKRIEEIKANVAAAKVAKRRPVRKSNRPGAELNEP